MTADELLAAITEARAKGESVRAFEYASHLAGLLKGEAKTVDPKLRNYVNVADGLLRAEIEPPWNALSDELDVCYYQYWRRGQSRPFQGHDLLDQDGFNKLSAAIDFARVAALHEASDALDASDPKKIPARRSTDGDGLPLKHEAQRKLADLAREGFVVTLDAKDAPRR